MHCHLLPGVDDGARDIDESLEGIEVLRLLGYEGAVLTPHIYRGAFDNSEQDLKERFDAFRAEVAGRIEGFELQLAAEYLLDDAFIEKLYDQSQTLLKIAGDPPKLLIEFTGLVEPLNALELIDECRRQGIQPIIAHIERYPFSGESLSQGRLQEWRTRGALLQMNLGSLVGHYGGAVQRTARQLWKGSVIDLLGTDMHRPYGVRRMLTEAWEYVQHKPTEFNAHTQRSLFGDNHESPRG